MGEAIDMFDRSRRVGGGVSNSRLFQEIRSEETSRMCSESIGELIRTPSIIIPDIEAKLVEPPKETGTQGACYFFTPNSPDEELQLLVADANFPNYLVNNGVDKEVALSTAAVFARSLEFLSRALSRRNTWHHAEKQALQRIASGRSNDAYWHEALVRSSIRTHFRAAGAVAIKSTGIDFDTTSKPPYAPHIAALMDPVKSGKGTDTKGSFLELQEIITAAAK